MSLLKEITEQNPRILEQGYAACSNNQLRAGYWAPAGTGHLTVGHQRTVIQAVHHDLGVFRPQSHMRVDTDIFCHLMEMTHSGTGRSRPRAHTGNPHPVSPTSVAQCVSSAHISGDSPSPAS